MRDGTVTVDFFSDLGNGQRIAAPPTGTIAVSGTVYREAAAALALAHPIVHVGDIAGDPLLISNTAAADGFSESLIASVIGASGAITAGAAGPTGDIVAGGSDSSLGVTLDTAQAGIITGQVTLAVTSDGTGIDNLGSISEGDQTLTISGTVQNYATASTVDLTSGGPAVTQNGTNFAINLGQVATGLVLPAITLGVANIASGPADALDGAFSAAPATGFSLSTDLASFLNVGAGADTAGPEVTLDTGTAGVFSQTVTLTAAGTNASGYDAALPAEVVTITGTVGRRRGSAQHARTDHAGEPASRGARTPGLSFTNSATPPAEALDVSVAGTPRRRSRPDRSRPRRRTNRRHRHRRRRQHRRRRAQSGTVTLNVDTAGIPPTPSNTETLGDRRGDRLARPR